MKWKKPSGLEIETNELDATVKYCESLGWERMNGQVPEDDPPEPSTTPNPDDSSEPEESQR